MSSIPGAPAGSFRLRVLDRDGDTIAGRVQSQPGRESLDELAAGCAATLVRKGVLG